MRRGDGFWVEEGRKGTAKRKRMAGERREEGTMTKSEPEPNTLRPTLLRAPEAAEMLAVSPRKLWELTNRKLIPCVRIGRAVRYDPRDVAAWIEEQKIHANRGRSPSIHDP